VACSLTPDQHAVDGGADVPRHRFRDSLLAVPFFLLVGELMTSADVTNRMIKLAQVLVGHLRGGSGAGGDAVQHVLRRDFGLIDGRLLRS
jgi:hypothetical protein